MKVCIPIVKQMVVKSILSTEGRGLVFICTASAPILEVYVLGAVRYSHMQQTNLNSRCTHKMTVLLPLEDLKIRPRYNCRLL